MDNGVRWLPRVVLETAPETNPRLETSSPVSAFDTPTHARILTLKNEIEHLAVWDDAKKLTNPYEFIFLSLQRRMSKSVSARHPLSRSYFKMIEIWEELGLGHSPSRIRASVHTAEGPGGFLEAIQDRLAPSHIPMLAMTLRSTEKSVPGWRKSQAFLSRYPGIQICYGADGTGNLYSLANQCVFADLATAPSRPPATLYTADGGFDFSADFNGQENTVQRLLVAELLAGLTTLAVSPESTMIVKLFDTKQRGTLELLYVVSSCFERTGLLKPCSSRPANSERYWVAQGYRARAPAWLLALLRILTASEAPLGWSRILSVTSVVDPAWIHAVRAFQCDLEEHQVQAIQLTLDLIRHPLGPIAPGPSPIYRLLLNNIRSSRAWCARYRIPVNPAYAGLTDEEVADLNLEDARAPFQVSAGRAHSQGASQPPPTHRGLISRPVQFAPIDPVWRSALPASVLGREASQRVSETPPSSGPTPDPRRDSAPVAAQLELQTPSDGP